MQPGPERLEESHAQIMVVLIAMAAVKGGLRAPTSCPVLYAYCNESMPLHLGKHHLKRTVRSNPISLLIQLNPVKAGM